MLVAPSSHSVWHSHTAGLPLVAPKPIEPLRRCSAERAWLVSFSDTRLARCALGGDVGANVTGRVADGVVGGDLERAYAVVELAGDRTALVGDQPAGRVGSGHRVVRSREDDLVDAPRAQLGIAVARQLTDRRRA